MTTIVNAASNEPIETPRNFIGICAHFFGKHPGQSLKDFSEELKKLTPKDREEMMADFRKMGYVLKD